MMPRRSSVNQQLTGRTRLVFPVGPEILNPFPFSDDRFGYSVSVSGNYMVVGAQWNNQFNIIEDSRAGQAYIFSALTGILLHVLDDTEGSFSYFGNSVATDGVHCVVGAPARSGNRGGSSYVYDCRTGTLLYTLQPLDDGNRPYLFGHSVAIDGNRIAIGEYGRYVGSLTLAASGAVSIYDTDTGNLLYLIKNPNTYGDATTDWFGYSVDIDNGTLVAGAPQEETSLSGIAYIFDVETGTLRHTLLNPNLLDTVEGDKFGWAVAISGDRCIIGAPGEDATSNILSFGTGLAHIYDINTGDLLETIYPPAGAPIGFGRAVDINKNNFLVNAGTTTYLYALPTAPETSSTLIQSFPGGVSNLEENSVSIDENSRLILVGSYQSDLPGIPNPGSIFVFDQNPNQATRTTYEITASAQTVNVDGSFITFTIDTSNVSEGTNLYYRVVGIDLPSETFELDSGTVQSNGKFNTVVAFKLSPEVVPSYLDELKLEIRTYEEQIVPTSISSGVTLLHISQRFLIRNPNAYDTGVDDLFGWSVAVDGDRCIVGVPYEDDAGGVQSGKAYIFDLTTGSLLHTLDNPNAFAISDGDLFGISVAISGDRCIVGAHYENDAGGSRSGKAYIFDVTTGALLHTLDNPNDYGSSAFDEFGYAVSISGDRCIVGARYEDIQSYSFHGRAYIFDVTDGSLLHTLNPNATSNLELGFALAIDGDRCVVGAPGSASVYIFSVTDGSLLHVLNNPNVYGSSGSDQFGRSVSISGDRCIVGAYAEDEATGVNSGKAYIFNVTTGALLHTLDNPNAFSTSANDYFGRSLAISGNFAIVSAPEEDDTSGGNSGKAYVFDVTDGLLLHTLEHSAPFGGDSFGYSVAISGDIYVAGVTGDDPFGVSNAGTIFVFTYT